MYSSVQALLEASPSLPSDSSLLDTLYSNAALASSQQKDLISTLLTQREEHLRRLAVEKACLDEALDLIRGERERMEAQCNALRKATASPIRTLPVDALRDIFSLSIEPTPHSDPPFEYSVPPHMQSLLRLTHICRWWRQILHDTPTLWQQLILTLRGIANPQAQSCIEQWPVHASNLPLSYTIWADPSYSQRHAWEALNEDARETLCLRAVSGMMRSGLQFPSRRVKDLRLALHARHVVPALSSLGPLAFSSLESLQLHFLPERTDDGEVRPTVSNIYTFEDAINLSSLHLTAVVDNTFGQHLRLRWSALTDLTLRLGGPSDAFIAILKLCPGLRTLHIDEGGLKAPLNMFLYQLWDALATPLLMDHLRVLRFERRSTCLTSLNTPNLSTAEFQGLYWQSARPLFSAFLQRAPNITFLTFAACDFCVSDAEGASMRPLLRLLPQVELLVFDDCSLNVLRLFDDLTVRSRDTLVLPCLQRLHLIKLSPAGARKYDAIVDTFVAMIDSRAHLPSVSPIQRIELWPRTNRVFPPDFVSRVRGLLVGDVELILP
ncbi:uncharacterized protein SCHCODRAFT_01147006 [Schizophyllum commune H4-8]|nr:uncharacterized protein SCHCODRAFT_01147006 [Schizophyllum commune H4-8]KAI5899271.1 hypothetical protein SCHCODRAFT_01147006 [Schizophyllum commune H4-8]